MDFATLCHSVVELVKNTGKYILDESSGSKTH